MQFVYLFRSETRKLWLGLEGAWTKHRNRIPEPTPSSRCHAQQNVRHTIINAPAALLLKARCCSANSCKNEFQFLQGRGSFVCPGLAVDLPGTKNVADHLRQKVD